MIDENKLLLELFELGKNAEKHLENAEKNQEEAFGFSIKNELAMLKNVISRVKNQPKIGEWIPCSERLPEEDGFYLSTIDGEIAGMDKSFTGLAEFEKGKWVDDEGDYKPIIAWRPLPEPYKEVRNGG